MIRCKFKSQEGRHEEAKASCRWGRMPNRYGKKSYYRDVVDVCLSCERAVCPGECDDWRRARNERKDGRGLIAPPSLPRRSETE